MIAFIVAATKKSVKTTKAIVVSRTIVPICNNKQNNKNFYSNGFDKVPNFTSMVKS